MFSKLVAFPVVVVIWTWCTRKQDVHELFASFFQIKKLCSEVYHGSDHVHYWTHVRSNFKRRQGSRKMSRSKRGGPLVRGVDDIYQNLDFTVIEPPRDLEFQELAGVCCQELIRVQRVTQPTCAISLCAWDDILSIYIKIIVFCCMQTHCTHLNVDKYENVAHSSIPWVVVGHQIVRAKKCVHWLTWSN